MAGAYQTIGETSSTSGYQPWDPALASTIIAGFAGTEGAELPILHALQAAFGHVPKASEPMIADALNRSRAEIHGVITFYHDFRHAPAGRHVLKLCRAEACQSMGAAPLAERLLHRLGLDWGGTTGDGSLTVEATYCLGLCACGPAALLNDEPIARLDDATLATLTEEAARA